MCVYVRVRVCVSVCFSVYTFLANLQLIDISLPSKISNIKLPFEDIKKSTCLTRHYYTFIKDINLMRISHNSSNSLL